jgi:hypothetical protein
MAGEPWSGQVKCLRITLSVCAETSETCKGVKSPFDAYLYFC